MVSDRRFHNRVSKRLGSSIASGGLTVLILPPNTQEM